MVHVLLFYRKRLEVYMLDLEKIVNKKVVLKMINHYVNNGKKRIYELFDGKKERSIKAFFGRIPINMIINIGMKKIGLNEEMKRQFFSKYHNKQTIMNILKTVGPNGLKQPFRFDAPLVVVWNYTNLCNLRCKYCYQSAGKSLSDELSFKEKVDLINQMVDANVAYLAFSGGEPILGDRFWDVLSYASKFFHISIASNGTLLENRDIVNRLADNGAKNVFVSLDGPTPESHEYIRGKGNFKRTINGIENLVANKYLNVGINTVVTKRNYGEVPKILELALKLGVNSFSHYNFIPTGRGKDDYEMDLTPEERENLLNLLYDWHVKRNETGLNIISTSPQYLRILYERSGGKSVGLFHYTADNADAIKGVVKYAGGCGAGRVYEAIQPNGDVSPCVFMPTVVVGNIRKKRFIDIWKDSDIGVKLSDRDNYHFFCEKYHYICGGCRARALAYGDIIGKDPGCILNRGPIKKYELERANTKPELVNV